MQDKTYILELATEKGTAQQWKVNRNSAFDFFEDQNRDTISELFGFCDHRSTLTLWTLERVNDKMEVTRCTLRCKVYTGMDERLIAEITRVFGKPFVIRPRFEYGQRLDRI